jgi:hypothetical protein
VSHATFVVSDKTGIVGGIIKETAEVGRAVFDFSCWLDKDEVVGLVSRFSLANQGSKAAVAWQPDYPFDPVDAAADPPADDVPLVFTGSTTDAGRVVNVLVGAGTPGLTYTASFVAVGNRSGREKQINFLVTIPQMTNAHLISTLDPAPSVSFTTVTASTPLLLGTTGTVFVDNATGGEITITLPPSPAFGQTVKGVDAAGNAWQHTIHWVAAAGALITGAASYDFRVAFQSAEFQWDGVEWIVL